MKDIKAPIPKITVQDTIQYFADNIQAPRDLIFVNIPSAEEIKELSVTKSGLMVKGAYNEFLYTVLATGFNVPDLNPGDKVYIKVKALEQQMIDEHSFAIISPFQVIAKRK